MALDSLIAARIMFRGMAEGWFTGKKLGDYFNAKEETLNARQIINGNDCDELIAVSRQVSDGAGSVRGDKEDLMISALISLIVWLLVIGILYWVVIYVLDAVPIPYPPNRIIKIVLTVVMCLVAVMVILDVFNLAPGLDMPRLTN